MPCEGAKEEDGTRKWKMEMLCLVSEITYMLGFQTYLERKPQKAGKYTLQILLNLYPSKIIVTFTGTVRVLTRETTDQHSRAWLL